MATFTAEVEVNISDFSNNDVVYYVRNKMVNDIIFADLMKKELSISVGNIKVPNVTLLDKQKSEFIQNNWDKLTLEKLENCIK